MNLLRKIKYTSYFILILILSGCGDSDSKSPEEPTSSNQPSTPTPSENELTFADFAAIYEKVSHKRESVHPSGSPSIEFCNTEPTKDASEILYPSYAKYSENELNGEKYLVRSDCTSATECSEDTSLLDNFSTASENTLSSIYWVTAYSESDSSCNVSKIERSFTISGNDAVIKNVSKRLVINSVTEESCDPDLAKQRSEEIVNCESVEKITLKKLQ
jgi:hypothetical protein